jgi:hypothetical protein
VNHLRTFGRFWYDFVIGDDWRLALGVVAMLAVVDLAARHGAHWWWLLPIAVAALLGVSLGAATRRSGP